MMSTKSKSKAALCVFVMTIFIIAQVSSGLNCWMCPGGQASFNLCDQNKVNESCKPDLDRCGTFSYYDNKTSTRIFAKSCTSKSLCSGNNTFCSVIKNALDCRVQCCEKDLCNFEVGFASTLPPIPTTILPPTTTKPPTTTRPPTTTKLLTSATTAQTSTEPSPTEPDTSPTPGEPTKDTQGDSDKDDCSWVDSAASTLTSPLIFLFGLSFLSFALD